LKAIVIGLDAASHHLIRKWIDRLPNLARLSNQGIHGILESVVPPSSIPAWQCFATGKGPAKIGNLGFIYIDRNLQIRHGSTTPDMRCIWDICSDAGLTVGVFNVPGTHPPYPVNGFMVAGFPVHLRESWSYPASLMKRLDSAIGGYEVDVPLTKPSEMRGGEVAFQVEVERLHRKSVKSAKLLIDWFHPDLFVMTLQGLDMIQHYFSHYMEDPRSRYTNTVRDWYVKMDKAVGEISQMVEEDTHVMVMSDHGSVPVSTSFHINEFLRSQGLLVGNHNGTETAANGGSYLKIRRFAMKHVPMSIIRTLYNLSPSFISDRFTVSAEMERVLRDLIQSIDWKRTLAFSTGGHGAAIYVNSAKNGHGESSALPTRSEIVRKVCNLLSELTDPISGEKVRPVFHLGEETFRGPHQTEAPDLVVELFERDQKIQVNPRLGSRRIWNTSAHFSATHVRDGFWALAGPHVRPGVELNASILDLAPTLLRLLGLEVAEDFDGHVLHPVFSQAGPG
jgi:predicted AlkP superfamily phosphohydrolase/phosphomutase